MDDRAFLYVIAGSVMIGAYGFGLLPKTRRGLGFGLALVALWVFGFMGLELATRGLNVFGTGAFFFGAAVLGGVAGLIGLGTQAVVLANGGRRAVALRLVGAAVLIAAYVLLFLFTKAWR
ncbi:MAG: hypothetical protein WAT09_09190 [Paracoccaceae bacterium]